MLHEIIKLNQIYNLKGNPTLEIMIPYTCDMNLRQKSRGILICPGGAYSFISIREGDSVALKYMSEGYVTFVLKYSIHEAYPTPMHELACAIDYLRKNSEKYYLNKDEITILGFSAGGHLVSSYGYLYKHPDFLNKTNMIASDIKPNCIISCYPVITMNDKTHLETRENITGNNKKLYDLLSVEKNIDNNYPPTFLWTTKEDLCVPFENSLLFAEELKKHNILHEFVLFNHLDHGKSVGTKLINDIGKNEAKHYKKLSTWVEKSFEFLNKVYTK